LKVEHPVLISVTGFPAQLMNREAKNVGRPVRSPAPSGPEPCAIRHPGHSVNHATESSVHSTHMPGRRAQASSAGRLDAIKQPGRTRMTTEFGGAPTLRSYIGLVRRRKWWIAAAALLGLAASLGLSLTQAKQYSATAQLLVQPAGSTALGVAPAAVTP